MMILRQTRNNHVYQSSPAFVLFDWIITFARFFPSTRTASLSISLAIIFHHSREIWSPSQWLQIREIRGLEVVIAEPWASWREKNKKTECTADQKRTILWENKGSFGNRSLTLLIFHVRDSESFRNIQWVCVFPSILRIVVVVQAMNLTTVVLLPKTKEADTCHLILEECWRSRHRDGSTSPLTKDANLKIHFVGSHYQCPSTLPNVFHCV